MILLSNNHEKNQGLPEETEQRNAYCFLALLINQDDSPSNQETARRVFNESNEDMQLIDPLQNRIFFRKDGEVTDMNLSNIGFISVVDKADKIISELFRFIDGKTGNKDIVMPIRAAIEAGAIRKPTPSEFNEVFGNTYIGPIGKGLISSKSALNDYCNLSIKHFRIICGDHYKKTAEFDRMVESFREIIAN